MDDRVARIQQKMLGIRQEMLKVLTEEMQGWMDELMKGMLDPSKIMGFIRSMGIDASQLPGVVSQQPGFDPYQVLGLDKSASDEEIKKRYRELINKLHPDKSGTPGTNFLFQMVVGAFELIKRERGWQ